jgi:hypothetical protein
MKKGICIHSLRIDEKIAGQARNDRIVFAPHPVIRTGGKTLYIMRGMVLLYDMGKHTGSPLCCDIIDLIDNDNHGNDNVGANLCVRPIMCSPYITNLHRVRYKYNVL